MLASMKRKALQLQIAGDQKSETASKTTKESVPASDRPVYDAIIAALEKLQPDTLELIDNSYQHAGHAGANAFEGTETHFDLHIAAAAFEGLNLVKRHRLIYMMLGEVMPKIHALQIQALTPAEALKQGKSSLKLE
jgi:BolA-like protein 1